MGIQCAGSYWRANMQACVVHPSEKEYRRRVHEFGRHDEDTTTFIMVYLDNIFLTIETTDDHLILLDVSFCQLSEMHSTLCIGKCFIMKKEFHLIGAVVSEEGRRIQPECLAARKRAVPPHSVSELRT